MYLCVSFIHSFIYLSTYLVVHLLIRLFIQLFITNSSILHSFIHSCIHAFMHLFIHSFIRSFIHAFVRSFICPVIVDMEKLYLNVAFTGFFMSDELRALFCHGINTFLTCDGVNLLEAYISVRSLGRSFFFLHCESFWGLCGETLPFTRSSPRLWRNQTVQNRSVHVKLESLSLYLLFLVMWSNLFFGFILSTLLPTVSSSVVPLGGRLGEWSGNGAKNKIWRRGPPRETWPTSEAGHAPLPQEQTNQSAK